MEDRDGITADFMLPDDEGQDLRVTFDRACIVRLLDEMSLSTEDDLGPAHGLVPEHFAYRLEGASFAQSQSSAWKLINAPAVHYRCYRLDLPGCIVCRAPAFSLNARA